MAARTRQIIPLPGRHLPHPPSLIFRNTDHGEQRLLLLQLGPALYDPFSFYDPDALQPFSRRLAKDIQPGDQICAFSQDFVDSAREKLHLSATAPEVLTLYHKTVAEAAAKLPGHTSDIHISAHGLDCQIAASAKGNLTVSVAFSIYVRTLTSWEELKARPSCSSIS